MKAVWLRTAVAAALALLLPVATAWATPATVMVSGAVSGTTMVDVDLGDNDVSFVGKEVVPGGQSTHGGYLSPDGTLYVGGFSGGGLQIFKKQNNGWNIQGTVSLGRASMISAVGLKKPEQDPVSGLLSLNDTSSGSEYLYNMIDGSVVGRFYRMPGLCDTSYGSDGSAWASGHGSIFHWFSPVPGVELLDIPGSHWGESGRHNDVFRTGAGTEYLVVAESGGDLVFIRTADSVLEKRVHLADGELYGVAVYDGRWLAASNFNTGDLLFVRAVNADGELDPHLVGSIDGAQVNGGLSADIAGVGFVSVDGAWTRN